MEKRMAESKGSITKQGHFQTSNIMALEIHVKDEERFPASGRSSASTIRMPGRSFHSPLIATRAISDMRLWILRSSSFTRRCST